MEGGCKRERGEDQPSRQAACCDCDGGTSVSATAGELAAIAGVVRVSQVCTKLRS